METMSKFFKLDNGKSFWQSGIYRKREATGINQSPQNVLTMYEYSHKFFSNLQAFFTKKDIFSSKTSFGLLISGKLFNVNYRKQQRHGMNHAFQNNYEY